MINVTVTNAELVKLVESSPQRTMRWVAKSKEERQNSRQGAEEEHRQVAKHHGDEKVEVRRESKWKVRECAAGGCGVDVLREAAGDELPDWEDRDGGEEAEQEAEHRHGHADCRRHGFHLELHLFPGSKELLFRLGYGYFREN